MNNVINQQNIKHKNKRVFVSGNFFFLHPGHVRLLKFASECAEKLYVGVHNTRPSKDYPSAQERADSLKELGFVHDVVVLDEGLEKYLSFLKPELIVKGREYEGSKNIENEWISAWGGKLLFSAGDAVYSGSNLLRDSHLDQALIWRQPKEYINRHDCHRESLLSFLDQIQGLRVAVVGDLIVDEYIQCEALGMSREDPTLVVSPQDSKMYLGGAGIVAAHCKGLGAKVFFYSVLGKDNLFTWVKNILSEYEIQSMLFTDEGRPTTLKQRYRVGQKTMIRVSHLRQHEVSAEIQEKIYSEIEAKIKEIDCLIFSDFNYGLLPQLLVDRLIKLGKNNNVFMAADSQASSQMGNIARFSGVNLITPTEHEARISLKDNVSGLNILAKELMLKSNATLAAITLGEAGSLVIDSDFEMDRLPSMNTNPLDVSGAGDSMLVGISLVKALGASSFQAAYIGAIASGIQVGRIGNTPIKIEEIKEALV
jgi:rfaE bifunctional protein kinase chain/domain